MGLALAAALLAAGAAHAQPAQAPRRNPADPATWTTGRAADYRAPDDVAFEGSTGLDARLRNGPK